MKKNILLINSPIEFNQKYNTILDTNYPPLGLAYLAAIAIENDFNVDILDFSINYYSPDFIKEKMYLDIQIIGISATTLSFKNALLIAKNIRKYRNDIIIIIGGPHITAKPDDFNNDLFDYGIIGEAEYSFLDLINNIKSGKNNIENIDGLIFKKNNKIVINQKTNYIQNIDNLPMPAIEKINNFDRYSPTRISVKCLPAIQIITSRGCPFHCIFCDKKVFGNKYRQHSPERVIAEIKKAIKLYKIREIKFFDDLFTFNRERVINICELLLKEKINISWSCQTRLDYCDVELLKIMKRSGCWQICAGIEKITDIGLNNINKNITFEKIRKSIDGIQRSGIEFRGYFIFGFPNDTIYSIKEEVKKIKKIYMHTVNFFPLMLLPGAELTKQISTQNIMPDNLHYIPNNMTLEQLNNTIYSAYLSYYTNPIYILKTIKYLFFNPQRFYVYLISFIYLLHSKFNKKISKKIFNA